MSCFYSREGAIKSHVGHCLTLLCNADFGNGNLPEIPETAPTNGQTQSANAAVAIAADMVTMDTTAVNKCYVRDSCRKQWSCMPLQTQTQLTTLPKRRTKKMLKFPSDLSRGGVLLSSSPREQEARLK